MAGQYDEDYDPHAQELRILARRERILTAQLLAHPDPRDPEHPVDAAMEDDEDE